MSYYYTPPKPEPKKETKVFHPEDWEKVICTEVGEKAQCQYCNQIIEWNVVGEHMFCDRCHCYLWREIVRRKDEPKKDETNTSQ